MSLHTQHPCVIVADNGWRGRRHHPDPASVTQRGSEDQEGVCRDCGSIIVRFLVDPEDDRVATWTRWMPTSRIVSV